MKDLQSKERIYKGGGGGGGGGGVVRTTFPPHAFQKVLLNKN